MKTVDIPKKERYTSVFLVRHGEVYNPTHILPGRLPNFHLSTHGKTQAKRAGSFLKNHGINIIYSSPLERCQETAKIIQTTLGDLPLHSLENLIEVNTARDGEPLENLERDKFNFFSKKYIARGAESMEKIYKRGWGALQIIIDKHKGKNIVAVTHGDILIFLKMKLLWNALDFNLSRGPHYPTPCSILHIIFDNKNHPVQSTEVNFYS